MTGTVVTVDAQRDTADYLVKEKYADYVMEVKGNQPHLHEALETLDVEDFVPPQCTFDKGQGQLLRVEYITGLGPETADATRLSELVRGHWGTENPIALRARLGRKPPANHKKYGSRHSGVTTRIHSQSLLR